jgi:hypothetical protein
MKRWKHENNNPRDKAVVLPRRTGSEEYSMHTARKRRGINKEVSMEKLILFVLCPAGLALMAWIVGKGFLDIHKYGEEAAKRP